MVGTLDKAMAKAQILKTGPFQMFPDFKMFGVQIPTAVANNIYI